MIILKATTESLTLVTSSVAGIDCSVSYADITTTTFSPSTQETKITSATTTPICSAPAVSTQRQIKLISIVNIDAAVSNTITLYKLISATNYELWSGTLAAGESLSFTSDGEWVCYDSTNAIRASRTAAGSTNQIQVNSSGFLAGDADFTWDSSTNKLTLGGTDTGLIVKGITNEPSSPSAGNLNLYTKAICGKMQLKIKGPSGLDTPLQASLWQNNTVLFTPAAAAGVWQGTVGSNLGTAALVIPTTTNLYTMMRRSTFGSVVTTTNQQVGTRSEAMFCRGNATGLGGFLFACRFGFTSIKTGCRLFVGMASDTTALVTADPSTKLNLCGFGFDLADTAITFIHNDGTGTATKEAISGQGTLATNNTCYDAYIWCAPNDATVYYRLDKTDSGAGVTLVDSSTTTDLPVNTTLMCAHAAMSNGTANIVANDAVIGINRIYIETDR